MEPNHLKHNVVVRTFTPDKDYDMIKSWWDDHEDDCPPLDYLSEKGLIIEVDKVPIANGFLYKTDSKFCMLQFLVTDRKATKEVRDIALSYLINAAQVWAKLNKFGVIYASGSKEKYITRLENEGFFKVLTPQFHLFYKV